MELNSKTIVLTGGSSGIGLDLLRALGTSNTVINLSRRAPSRSDLAQDINFEHVTTDLATAQSVAAAVDTIKSLTPDGIDGLINCAAVQFTPRFTDPAFDPNTISREIAINLTSPIELIAGLLGSLWHEDRESFILNVNSGLGIVPKRESAVYCATKGGLDNFSRGLRAQLSSTPISVMQVFLPLVATPMTEGRGSGKLSSSAVARKIIEGVESGIADHDIGKVRLLRFIHRISPSFAHRIMQKGTA